MRRLYTVAFSIIFCFLIGCGSEPPTEEETFLEEVSLFSQEERILIQRELIAQGYTIETPDGIFTQDTRLAIAAWQRSTDRAASGYLDKEQGDILIAQGLEAPPLSPPQTEELLEESIERQTIFRANLERFQDCSECPEMIAIPQGTFVMGAPGTEQGYKATNAPPRSVAIDHRFAVSLFEITFDQWQACVDDNGCNGYEPDDRGWGRQKRPVINVNWEDAQTYVQWLSATTDQSYRLLTEAEWEYVARAGSPSRYWWGNDREGENVCRYANGVDDTFKSAFLILDGRVLCDDSYPYTAPVGSFSPNQFGLFDTSGNIWEWVQDCWRDSYHQESRQECETRVLRGGSWSSASEDLRSASRIGSLGKTRNSAYGFRVARSL